MPFHSLGDNADGVILETILCETIKYFYFQCVYSDRLTLTSVESWTWHFKKATQNNKMIYYNAAIFFICLKYHYL